MIVEAYWSFKQNSLVSSPLYRYPVFKVITTPKTNRLSGVLLDSKVGSKRRPADGRGAESSRNRTLSKLITHHTHPPDDRAHLFGRRPPEGRSPTARQLCYRRDPASACS